MVSSFFFLLCVLTMFAGVRLALVSGQGPVRKNVTCSFEPSARCDWQLLPVPHVGYNTSVVTAGIGAARFGGPSLDVNPGTGQGHYFHLSSNQPLPSEQLRILTIPSIKHQFTCVLSFAYYVVGPLDLEILQENLAIHSVILAPQRPNLTRWERTQMTFNTSGEYSGALAIVVSNSDLGEAAPEPGEANVFLAIDDILLTYCLPCDYDRLGDVGGITVGGAPDGGIDVHLRLVDHYQLNASAQVCPNETFTYRIESVEPDHVSPIFTIDTETGLLAVDGRGPNLDANGTQGVVNVSIHAANSNYSHTSNMYKYIVTIPFRQPPTLNHTAPPTFSVNIGETFSFTFMVISSLSRDVQLDLGRPKTTPPELLSDITITPLQNFSTISISGMISINRVLPLIVTQGIAANLSIPIEDTTNGGVIYAQTQLLILPSPPLFNQSSYEFNVVERSNTFLIGSFSVIDPNGDLVHTPMANTSLFSTIPHNDLSDNAAFKYFDILAIFTLNYEQQTSYSFTITARDGAPSSTLSSVATVTVNVLPINEFPPVFQNNHKEITISDVKPVGSNVTEFVATDRDSGTDGLIDYTIAAGNEDGFFDISGVGFGEVIVQRSPILPHTYTLTIEATDRGTPSRSSNASLVVHVSATSGVDCTSSDYGPPEITSSGMVLYRPRGDNVTMDCQFTANPVERVYKWQHPQMLASIFPNTTDTHFTITPHSLTVHNLTRQDAGLYICNVTSQCGSSTIPFTLDITDYPNAPTDLNYTRAADTTSTDLSWTRPSISSSGFISTPLDGFVVQTRIDSKTRDFTDMVQVGVDVTEANVTGLFPGTTYSVRVVSFNTAGRTPSNVISFTTMADVPKLKYLRANGLANGTISLEWRLEYDGGHPIINFEIHVTSGAGRTKRDTTGPDLVYHTDVANNRLVTSPVRLGQTYSVMATAFNVLGASDPQATNAFVGHIDAASCGYDNNDDNRGCPWQLGQGQIINAQGATNLLPHSDADGNQFGHYISGSLSPSVNETTLLSYNQAGYICGLAFSYFLSNQAGLAVRSNPSGREVWSSLNEPMHTAGRWNSVNFMRAQYYLTAQFEETLEIVLFRAAVAGGSPSNSSGSSSNVLAAAVDNLNVQFCLPCNFEGLQNETQFTLDYEAHARIYLRQPQNLTVQAVLEECTQAVINFTITRVVPSDLTSKLSVAAISSQDATVLVGAISSLLALPNTIGFLEVTATVAHSDYLFASSSVERAALIEFVLLPTTQNCSLLDSCDFESACNSWQLGSESTITDTSLPPSIPSTSGHYLYSTYPRGALRAAQLTSAVINDSFCAVSFSYIQSSSLELQVLVDSLGSVWSSVEESSRFSPGRGGGIGSWQPETVEIDLQTVGVQPNRTLTFVISLAEGRQPGSAATEEYAALDNITLHPCVDCSAPECSFSTCYPGYFYSLLDEQCVACPKGYYCPNWWGLPQPCPPGTYSDVFNAASRTACLPCSVGSFAVKQASTTCQTCPAGYNCSIASSIPIAIDNSCPTTPTCQTGLPTSRPTVANAHSSGSTNPLLIAVGSIGCVILVVCIVSTGLLTCFCLRAKKRKDKKIKRERERREFLLRDSVSIGTAGSLGASTVNSAGSMINSRGGKRRLRKRGEVSTLLTFLSDEDPSLGSDPYGNETSWADTEQLTSRHGEAEEGGESASFVMVNNGFDDVSLDDRDDQDHHGNELSDLSWHSQRSRSKKSGRTTSPL